MNNQVASISLLIIAIVIYALASQFMSTPAVIALSLILVLGALENQPKGQNIFTQLGLN